MDEYSKTTIATLLKSIDLSRLKVTALDNNKNNIENITIIEKKIQTFFYYTQKMYNTNLYEK
jgi:hypothetical protein